VLAACRPLYIPPVPAEVPVSREPRIAEGGVLELVAGRPQLTFGIVGAVQAGWVDVQWFAPDGHEAASESRWVEVVGSDAHDAESAESAESAGGAGSTSAEVISGPWVLRLPDDVAVVSGEWRAVVSMQGRFLRQFRVVVPDLQGG